MSRTKDKEIAEKVDFSGGKRGVYFDRAKNGIRTFEVSDADDRARPSDTKADRSSRAGSERR